jgi:hypothetical protein
MICVHQTMGTVLVMNQPFQNLQRHISYVLHFLWQIFRVSRSLIGYGPSHSSQIHVFAFHILAQNTKLIYTHILREIWFLRSLRISEPIRLDMAFHLTPINSEAHLSSILCFTENTQSLHCTD